MNFNEKLISLRKSKGLSQEELPFLSVVLDLETTPGHRRRFRRVVFSVRRLFHKAGRMETGQRQDGEEFGNRIHQRPDHSLCCHEADRLYGLEMDIGLFIAGLSPLV